MRASPEAIAIQQKREADNLRNHQERLVWLSGERPLWSDCVPVCAHDRHVLLAQSRSAVDAATGVAL